MTLGEQWQPIPGYEDSYHASDQGRIRSIDREITIRKGRRAGLKYRRKGQILSPIPTQKGYLTVELVINGVRHKTFIHRLVARTFIGICPLDHECLHRDDVKSNNHLTNLRYGTSSENKHDSVRNGLHYNANKTHCKRLHELTENNIKRRRDKPNIRQCRKCTNNRTGAKRKTSHA